MRKQVMCPKIIGRFGLVWFGLYFGISTSTTITYPKYPGSMTLLEAVTKDPGYAYIDLWM
jgi:hypothetical protein